MKKTLYFLLLLICALVIGGLLANEATGAFAWLGWSGGFNFNPGTFVDTDVISLTFGLSMNISIAQVIGIIIAICAYIKTAPKVVPDAKK
ncbi:MAG: DUF4321 domain-containing protein [Ruminococcus sp.]|uniref:DUF4321 domain-containing protein n=1 Tax=Ruminococcus sp. TaxID=41978 RepID=UPI00156A713B|nr:DUF4321 domain-containing protein [Ruminococcus sp.]MCR5601469.1 DUF4321 domain-containing protein [Ruminococcus sp.]